MQDVQGPRPRSPRDVEDWQRLGLRRGEVDFGGSGKKRGKHLTAQQLPSAPLCAAPPMPSASLVPCAPVSRPPLPSSSPVPHAPCAQPPNAQHLPSAQCPLCLGPPMPCTSPAPSDPCA
ncbi:hypothetical protein P7K49_021229 [Saguinus oedipus]|uniref:Uncharacterized protein n=1 Tax=Saguinus oedipus TaxID=9490 RepID=A0ABQ9US44_SAGOE|nr:hypothetical protein P7K49_021229 [Saguinus oedipus]